MITPTNITAILGFLNTYPSYDFNDPDGPHNRPDRPLVYAWPFSDMSGGTPEYKEDLHDEWVRITGRVGLNWATAVADDVERECDRNSEYSKINVIMDLSELSGWSVPTDDTELQSMKDLVSDRWDDFLDLFGTGRDEDIEIIQIKNSSMWYERGISDQPDEHDNNYRVRDFNKYLYEKCKDLSLPATTKVERIGHCQVHVSSGDPKHHYRDSDPSDPAETGFSMELQRMCDPEVWYDDVRLNIEAARQWYIHQGSLQMALGADNSVEWPNIDDAPGERIEDTASVALPYDPLNSFYYGAVLARTAYHAEKYGEMYVGGWYPPVQKIKHVTIWPDPFHEDLDKVGSAHVCAFLQAVFASGRSTTALRDLLEDLMA